ncbi:hypothetical protein HX021_18920 [Sphingobacterium sp. N143]|nr:hypothetical protein [Sphingobacterium sp. N143]
MQLISLWIAIALPFIGNSQILSQIPKGYWVVCGDDKVLVINPAIGSDSSAIIWKWQFKESANQLPKEYGDYFKSLDDCKPVLDNKKILITSSTGATCLLNIANKQIEFYAKTPMAHSADLLPGNLVAVANSTHPKGNSLELYRLDQMDKVIYSDSLYSGHGVVWNDKLQQLFVLGYTDLRTYQLTTDKNALKLLNTIIIPGEGGHDLSYVDNDRLLVSYSEGIAVYSIKSKKFEQFPPLKDIHHIKSVNWNPISDQLVYTKAEESWWTYHIYGINPRQKVHIPTVKLYKVRVAH